MREDLLSVMAVALYCPACGTGAVSPTFVLVAAGAAVAFVTFLWWWILYSHGGGS
jgi:hypothetical protein